MAKKKQGFAEKVFGAEENSAAKLGAEKLSEFQGIADKMFHTNVLRTKELLFPAIASFAGSIINGVGSYRTLFFVNIFKLDMVYVAVGRFDGFCGLGLKPWDMAAASLMVLEAGGLISDLDGEQTWMEHGNVLAASPKVFTQMLAFLRQDQAG